MPPQMASIPKAQDLAKLSVDERLELMDELWASLHPEADALPMPEWHAAEIRRRLAREIDEIIRIPEVRERLAGWGAEPVGGTPEEMDAMLTAERARWAEVVRRAGIERE